MKIKVTKSTVEKVLALPPKKHFSPGRPSPFFRALIRILAKKDLKETNFTWSVEGRALPDDRTPALILMNHSAFIDLEIAAHVFRKKPYNIVCTSDGLIGKKWLMRRIGVIPTEKFVPSLTLYRDICHSLQKEKVSVLMYPEASYSFDGTATPLPRSLAHCVKKLGVPVLFVKTEGAFLRDPLYNNLQVRKTDVRATVEYLFTPEECETMSKEEIGEILDGRFSFDNFRDQKERHVEITDPFRADYLHRVLYKCPRCLCEGKTLGQGENLVCKNCGAKYRLETDGEIRQIPSEMRSDLPLWDNVFTHIPDWYRWQRECVKEQIADGTYRIDVPVKICMMVDYKSLYEVGEGRLVHTAEGFLLTGCDGKICYEHKPLASYSLYADYFWYEIGDVICIGDERVLYYCFPEGERNVVAKARLGAEEIYKLRREEARV